MVNQQILAVNEYSSNKLGIGVKGIPTGWDFVDNIMGGHQKGDLNTIVARPGTGKTYVLLKMAYTAWKEDNKVLFVSMEMTKEALIKRLLGISTKNNPKHFKSREVSNLFLDFISHGELKSNDNFIIADSSNIGSTLDLVGAIELLQPDIVYIDSSYLLRPQKKQGNNANRREIIAAVSEDLKALALEYKIPVVQTMQFNRQAKKDSSKGSSNPLAKTGTENIAEADVVGQLSSVVIGLATPTKEDSEQDFRYMGFLKGREGEQGTWKIRYRFDPVDFDFIEAIDSFDGAQNDQNEDMTEESFEEASFDS